MKLSAFKEFRFSAAHHLCIEGHRCSSVHGHNYKVRIEVEGECDENGMIIDFGKIKEIVQPLIMELDHTDLNGVMPITTSEGIAQWFAGKLKGKLEGLSRIEVRETETCGATLDLP